MKNLLTLSIVMFALVVGAEAQSPSPTPADDTENSAATRTVTLPGLPVVSPLNDYVRPNAKARQKRYVSSVVGPFALGRTVATAGLSTWRNSPEEWGDRWEGFGRRVASNFGKNAIKQSTIYGLDEAFKYDSNYYRSKDKSVGARVRNALISPVTARDRNGKRVVGVPRLVATYTSNIVAYETWYPARYDWKDGVKSGTISLGFNAAFNLFKEFVWKK